MLTGKGKLGFLSLFRFPQGMYGYNSELKATNKHTSLVGFFESY